MTRLAWLCLLFLLAPSAARAEWYETSGRTIWHEASSKHFIVYGEDARSVRQLAERLERFDQVLRRRTGVGDPTLGPTNRLTVFQVGSQANIESMTSRNVGGFYKGRASGSYIFVPRRIGNGGELDISADAVLFHEYAHHFMFSNYEGAFPPWLTEGFAEFHATVRWEKDGGIGLGAPPLYRAYGLLTGRSLPLETMLSGKHPRLDPEQLDALYGRGWLLMHYLTFGDGREGQFSKYVAELNAGKDGLQAGRSAFGDLKQLDRDLDKYLGQRRISYVKMAPGDLPTLPVALRALSAAESAIMRARIHSKSGVDQKEARQIVAHARKVASAHPNDALVNVTLAEAEYDVRNWAGAVEAADRALKADPTRAEAMIYKALARMEQVGTTGAEPAWREVRALLRAANRIDPEDPEPLMLFYTTYQRQGLAPTRNAVEGLNYALMLAHQDWNLRMLVARQALMDGKAKEARDALAPVAFAPHGGPMAEFAAGVLAKLDEAGPAAALAMGDAAEATAKAEAGTR